MQFEVQKGVTGHQAIHSRNQKAVNPICELEPVDQYLYEVTPEGVHGLIDNVWEWTASFYAADSYTREENSVWDGKEELTNDDVLVLRGGSFKSNATTSTIRLPAKHYVSGDDFGVRCVSD